MFKALGITALLVATTLLATPRPAQACAPARLILRPPVPPPAPPPPATRYAVPPPGTPVVIHATPLCPRVPVRVRCQSADVPCVRVIYRHVCRPRTPVVKRCPPPVYRRTYRRTNRRTYRRYYRPYRRPYARPPRIYRNLSPYHPKSTPYFGIGGGLLSFIKPTGGFEHLQAVANTSAFVGWNFGGMFALELGLGNTFFRPDREMLGDVSRVGLVAVTLDTKLRLVRPSPRKWAVPFLQAGLGVYTLAGGFPDACGDNKCKTRTMAHGGGIQAGGGMDFYLNRYAILGARVLYHHLFMSQLNGADDRVFGTDKPTRLHAVSAGVTLTLFWSHL